MQHPASSHPPLRLYYDADCNFCRRASLLLVQCLGLVQQVTRIPCQTVPPMWEEMLRRNSWLVETEAGIEDSFDAFLVLLSISRSWRWLLPLAACPPVRWLGHRIYRWIATNREAISSLTLRWLPEG